MNVIGFVSMSDCF